MADMKMVAAEKLYYLVSNFFMLPWQQFFLKNCLNFNIIYIGRSFYNNIITFMCTLQYFISKHSDVVNVI